MTTLLNIVGRSLLISCMIPTIVFVTVTMVVFAPTFPTICLARFGISDPEFGSVLAFILVIAFVLAYIFMIMNWVIVRLYEGYYLPFKSLFQKVHAWRKTRLSRHVMQQKKKLENIPKDLSLYHYRWRIYIEKKNQLTSQFPSRAEDILPFRLGNIYRAFEDYSFDRYGMDGVFFWSRLAKVIPADYAAKIEEQNNAIAFLLNSSFFSILIGVEVLISLKVVTLDTQALISLVIAKSLDLQAFASLINIHITDSRAIIPLLCLVLSYVFYYAATSTALTYGHYIRTCYDLFRLDLLKALQITPPAKLGDEEEKALWRSVHEFLVLGEGSPYQGKAVDNSPSALICAAAQLLQSWTELIFLNAMVHSVKWIRSHMNLIRINTRQLAATEGME